MTQLILLLTALASFVSLPTADDVRQAAHIFHGNLTNFVIIVRGLEDTAPLSYDKHEDVVRNASDSVVRIEARKEVPTRALEYGLRGNRIYIREVEGDPVEAKVSSGSGFFVTSNGYMVTNKHVVSDDDVDYVVNTGDREYSAKVVYRDPDHDLAVVKIAGQGFPTLTIDDSSDISIGDTIVTIGNALGRFNDSVSVGAISDFDQDISVEDGYERRNGRWVKSYERLSGLIETTAKVYPGDSGGPLLNEDGEVVGVNVATAVGERISYAIPAEVLKSVLKKAGIVLQ